MMKSIVGLMCFIILIWCLFYLVLFSTLSKGCDSLEKSGNGSIMNGLGKKVREINDNFNKGYDKKK